MFPPLEAMQSDSLATIPTASYSNKTHFQSLITCLVSQKIEGEKMKANANLHAERERQRERERTYRAMEDVDSVRERGERRWRVEGLPWESQGLEGPLGKSEKLGEAWRCPLDEVHFLSLSPSVLQMVVRLSFYLLHKLKLKVRTLMSFLFTSDPVPKYQLPLPKKI